MKKSVQSYVSKFNDIHSQYRTNRDGMFKVVREALERLSDEDFQTFSKSVDADRSTINKIKKICMNSVVMRNLDVLPASWGTLTAIARLDGKTIEDWISQGKLSRKTTLKEFKALRQSNGHLASSAPPSASIATSAQSSRGITLSLKKRIPTTTKETFRKYFQEMEAYFNISGMDSLFATEEPPESSSATIRVAA